MEIKTSETKYVKDKIRQRQSPYSTSFSVVIQHSIALFPNNVFRLFAHYIFHHAFQLDCWSFVIKYSLFNLLVSFINNFNSWHWKCLKVYNIEIFLKIKNSIKSILLENNYEIQCYDILTNHIKVSVLNQWRVGWDLKVKYFIFSPELCQWSLTWHSYRPTSAFFVNWICNFQLFGFS